MRRPNAIATLTVAVCAAAAAYASAWGPEGDRAAASPLVQEASDAATAPATSASPTASAPEATASPTPPGPAAVSPSSAPPATPSDAPSGEPSTVSPPPSPSAPPSDVASPATAADVELSYLAWNPETRAVEASGYAAVYEDGGTCRLVLTRSGTTTSAESAALTDVQTTSCGGLEVLGSELASGTWHAVLEYTSPTSAGSSAPREVVVP